MKKIMFGIFSILFLFSQHVLANEITAMTVITPDNVKSFGASYKWKLPAPGVIQLVKNSSTIAVSILYSVDRVSDTVIVRCPMNDTTVLKNNTYLCWLPPGEIAKVELKSFNFSIGASGTYAILA
ncbi:MAG: hypothetical protein ACD_46C00043G0001 [uncultured bacterium]|nr:MAG: hypothetical protein ACD_46C00043G0001 [uncultured bacterium]